mgnify:CR=1 FL=1
MLKDIYQIIMMSMLRLDLTLMTLKIIKTKISYFKTLFLLFLIITYSKIS